MKKVLIGILAAGLVMSLSGLASAQALFDLDLRGDLSASLSNFSTNWDQGVFEDHDLLSACHIYDDFHKEWRDSGGTTMNASVHIYPVLDFTVWCTHIPCPDWELLKTDALVVAGVFNYADAFQYDYDFRDVYDDSDRYIGNLTIGTMLDGIGAMGVESLIYAIGVY